MPGTAGQSDTAKEPTVKRRRMISRIKENAISLHKYCGGRKWQAYNFPLSGSPFALGDQLFRFRNCLSGSDNFSVQSSKDLGETWEEYSLLSCPTFNFQIVSVHLKSGTIVYFIGGMREVVNARGIIVHTRVPDVWVSRDMLKTCELVTDKAAFGRPEYFLCTASDDGTLYLRITAMPIRLRATWMSNDNGVSWTKPQRNADVANCYEHMDALAHHRGRLHAITVDAWKGSFLRDVLAFSEDNGASWQRGSGSFVPRLLLKDTLGDRLIAFSSTACFELVGDATCWRRVKDNWRDVIWSSVDGEKRPFFTFNQPWLFTNGVILMSSRVRQNVINFIISYPDKERANRDKLTLAMYLGRHGIDSALFQSQIAPFLFPY